MITLPTIEVPGFKEAIRHERTLRDRAFLGGNEIVCGVVVKQLSLRTSLFLEHAQNGFFIRFNFDDDLEVLAHALQVLRFSEPNWKAPEVEYPTLWATWWQGMKDLRFQKRVIKKQSPEAIVKEVREWIDDAMFDCPSGGQSDIPAPSYVSYPASLVDLFAAAGLKFTYDEILDMPLKRLWQHWRLAAHRVYDKKLTNPSDEIAVEHIAKGAA